MVEVGRNGGFVRCVVEVVRYSVFVRCVLAVVRYGVFSSLCVRWSDVVFLFAVCQVAATVFLFAVC